MIKKSIWLTDYKIRNWISNFYNGKDQITLDLGI